MLAWDIKTSCPKLQEEAWDSEESRSGEVSQKPRVGWGETEYGGAGKHCFNFLIPVYRLLLYPMIGQL